MGPGRSWRDVDERLLARLDDEQAVAALWRAQAPAGAPRLPERAAVLMQELRRREGGAAAVERAALGHADGVAAMLASPRLGQFHPTLLHALAVYSDRLAGAYEAELARGRDPERERRATGAHLRTLAAWIALSTRGGHFAEQLGAGGDADADPGARMVERCLGALARRATEGAGVLSGPGAAALSTLDRVGDACRVADVDAATSKRWTQRSDRLRARAVEAALAPLEDALGSLESRPEARAEAPALFEKLAAIWAWAGADEGVERFGVERLLKVVWASYHANDWPGLRAAFAPMVPVVTSLEARILGAPERHLAYSAKVAELLVFASDAEHDLAQRWALAERALRVCPAHRNARSTMAFLLCNRANHLLDNANMMTIRAELATAEQLLARAEQTFAASERIAPTRAKIEAARVRWGIPKPAAQGEGATPTGKP